jgi:hypothetical protein
MSLLSSMNLVCCAGAGAGADSHKCEEPFLYKSEAAHVSTTMISSGCVRVDYKIRLSALLTQRYEICLFFMIEPSLEPKTKEQNEDAGTRHVVFEMCRQGARP